MFVFEKIFNYGRLVKIVTECHKKSIKQENQELTHHVTRKL